MHGIECQISFKGMMTVLCHRGRAARSSMHAASCGLTSCTLLPNLQ